MPVQNMFVPLPPRVLAKEIMLFNSERKIRWIKKADKYIIQSLVILIYYLIVITGFVGKNKFFPEEPKKILFIKLFGIGNIFLLLPALRLLKSNYPEASIDLLTLSFNRGIVEHADDFNKAIYINGDSLSGCAKDMVKNLLTVRKNNYDLVFDFDQFANISALCSFLSNSFSVGFKTRHAQRHLLYSRCVPYIEDKHMSEIFKTLLVPLRCKQENKNTGFRLDKEERRIRDFLRGNDINSAQHFLVILHPGSSANFTNRRWPAQRFKLLAEKLLDYDMVRIILTGNSQDEFGLNRVIASSLNNPCLVDASGKFVLEEFIALIKLSSLIIASDTAPIQISTHFNRSCVSFYGPNTPFLYGPRNNNSIIFYKPFSCSPCISNLNSKRSNCRNPRCLEVISADEVFQEIKSKFLKKINSSYRDGA